MTVVRRLEDLDDLEKLSLIDMSYSRLNTYEMCPSKYFYSRIQKAPEVFGPPAVMGNVIHSVLEDTVGMPLNYGEMMKLMVKYRDEYDPEQLIDDKLLDAGRIMLAEFVDRHQGEIFEVVAKEMPFQIVVGSALIRGYIDLVFKRGDHIAIADYKSGTFEVAKKRVHENLQLGIYALALSDFFPDQDSFYAELYYLRSGKRKGHSFTPEDLSDVADRLVEEVNVIVDDKNFRPTDNRRICSFCDYANGVCPTGTARMRYR